MSDTKYFKVADMDENKEIYYEKQDIKHVNKIIVAVLLFIIGVIIAIVAVRIKKINLKGNDTNSGNNINVQLLNQSEEPTKKAVEENNDENLLEDKGGSDEKNTEIPVPISIDNSTDATDQNLEAIMAYRNCFMSVDWRNKYDYGVNPTYFQLVHINDDDIVEMVYISRTARADGAYLFRFWKGKVILVGTIGIGGRFKYEPYKNNILCEEGHSSEFISTLYHMEGKNVNMYKEFLYGTSYFDEDTIESTLIDGKAVDMDYYNREYNKVVESKDWTEVGNDEMFEVNEVNIEELINNYTIYVID